MMGLVIRSKPQMKKLIFNEFKKLWSKTTIITVSSLILLLMIMAGVYYIYYENSVITSSGEKVVSVGSYWSLKEESKEFEGQVDQNYLDNFVKEFESSIEKKNFSHRFGRDTMRFNIASYLLNFPADLEKTSNFSMRFDYDYLKTEEKFYEKYKEGVKEVIRKQQKLVKNRNEFMWFQYTDEQLEKIDNKVDSLKTPFKVSYYLGLEKVIFDFTKQYWLVLIVLSFVLCGVFSKDSRNGIDEITLASACGRKKNMNAKIIAGNLFSITVYFIFIATILILNGIYASLHGWGMSAQVLWRTCLYNISIGTAIMIMFAMGLLGTLLIANFVMLVSISTKYVKLSALCSIASVLILVELAKTTNMLQLQFNPIYFSTKLQLDAPVFIGDMMIPYFVFSALIAIVYFTVIRLLTVKQYKRYTLRG